MALADAAPASGGGGRGPLARTADRPDDYRRLGISPHSIAAREDGMRTDGRSGSYEWWYFDAHLDDGTALVITFYTKESLATWTGLRPSATAELTRPGHATRTVALKVPSSEFSASTEQCEVRVGDSTFRGRDGRYEIHFAAEDVVIDITLRAQVPAWRPETGHFYFGPHDDHLFAWLPAVPQGIVNARIVEAGETSVLDGVGYHDHNWGDASMMRLMNHWYWGRAQAGPYSVIASWLVAEKRYGYTEIPIFMLAKAGEIIADRADRVALTLAEEFEDEASGKPVANRIVYEYRGDGERYRVTFAREQTISRTLAREVDSAALRALVAVARIDGAYLRFTGRVTVEHFVGEQLVETAEDPGIWELAYFGRTHRLDRAPGS